MRFRSGDPRTRGRGWTYACYHLATRMRIMTRPSAASKDRGMGEQDGMNVRLISRCDPGGGWKFG